MSYDEQSGINSICERTDWRDGVGVITSDRLKSNPGVELVQG